MGESVCYRISVNGTTKFYIGSTNNFYQRKHSHMSALKTKNRANPHLQMFYDLGHELDFLILASGTREEMYAYELEQLKLNSTNPDLLNINISTIGGMFLERHPFEDVIRENKSKAAMGIKNPMYGKTHSKETRNRLSIKNKGRSPPNKGVPMLESQKKVLSELAKKRTGVLNGFYGKRHSEQTKQMLKNIFLGRKPTNTNVIEIDGVTYKSQADAAKALNVSQGTITHRINSRNPKFNGYVVIKQG